MSRLQWQPVQATGAFNPVDALDASGKMFGRAGRTVNQMAENSLREDMITSSILDTKLDDEQKKLRIGAYTPTDQETQLPDHVLMDMIQSGQGMESIDTGNRNDMERFHALSQNYGSQLDNQRQTALAAINDSYNREFAIEQAKGYSPEDLAAVQASLQNKYAGPINEINRQFSTGARSLDANPTNVSSNYTMSLDQYGKPKWDSTGQAQPQRVSEARQAMMGDQSAQQVPPAAAAAPSNQGTPVLGTGSTNPHNAKTYAEVSETSPFNQIQDAGQRVNVMAFLDAIAKSEGADYNTLVGKGSFNNEVSDLSAHPNIVGMRTKDGPSTAAGKYQITGTTWKSLGHKGESDFSEDSQDSAAIELLKRRGAYDLVLQGDFEGAVNKLGNEWQGLPSGTSKNQGKRSWDDFNRYLKESLDVRSGNQQQVQNDPNDVSNITEEWASGRRGEQLGDAGLPNALPTGGYNEGARNLADVLGEGYGRESVTPEQMMAEANSKVSIDPLNYDGSSNVFKVMMDDLKVEVKPVKQLDATELKTAVDTLANELSIKPDVARAQLFNTSNKYGGLTESELYEIALRTPVTGNWVKNTLVDAKFDEVALKRNIKAAKKNKENRAETSGRLEDIQSKFSALDVIFKASNNAITKEMEYLNDVARKGGNAVVINSSQKRLDKAMKTRDSAQRDLEKIMTEGNKIYSKYMTEIKEPRPDVDNRMDPGKRDAAIRELTDQPPLAGDSKYANDDRTVSNYPPTPSQIRENNKKGMSQTEKNRSRVLESNPIVEYVRGKQNELYIRDLEDKDPAHKYGLIRDEVTKYGKSSPMDVINGGSGMAEVGGVRFTHLPERFNRLK